LKDDYDDDDDDDDEDDDDDDVKKLREEIEAIPCDKTAGRRILTSSNPTS
jgi:hypothetical protein